MFKKPIKIGAQNQLSGKDKKVIKSKMSESFNQQCVQKMLTSNDKIICSKVSGSKMLIYVGQQYPLVVDGTGKNNYFPSIYVCAAYQPLLKSLVINEGVQTYIFNGANLMWPGVRQYEGLENFNKDEVVAIRSSKGEIIAIGAMGCSLQQLKKSNDFSGVANYILHYKGDKLWEMGPKTYPQIIVSLPVKQVKKQQEKSKVQEKRQQLKQQQKKPSKKEQKSKQSQKYQQKKQQKPKSASQPQQESDDDADFMNLVHSKNNQPQSKANKPIKMQQKNNLKQAFVQDQNIQNKKNKKKQPKKVEKKQESQEQQMQEQKPSQKNKKKQPKKQQKKHQKSDQQQIQEDVMQEEIQQKEDKKKKGTKGKGGKNKKDKQPEKQKEKSKEEGEQNKQEQQAPSVINSKLMDQYFKQSLFNAIKLTKIQNQLPIDSGRFFMDFMLLARPEGVKLQIKDSSYKKIGKFFQEMSKQKIIEYKHTKDKKVQGAVINKIFWQNQQLKNFVPTIKKMNTKQSLQEKVQTYSKAKLKLSKTVICQTVYKPNQALFNLLFKKKVNYMPDNSQDEVTQNQKQQAIYVEQKQLREKIEKYINTIIENKQKKQEKQKQKEGKQKKVQKQKGILIDYKKHPFIENLLKKQIDQYEENKARQEILKPQDDDQDQKKKKKKKQKHHDLFKIDRPFLVQKIMKNAIPHYHLYDKETKLDKFKQGIFKGVNIVAEKANNKNITTITGLETFITPNEQADDQINGFANQLQLKFACSVNVQNLPGKNAGKQIIVHGTFLDELVDLLQEQYGLSNKFITTQNKLDKKKKH